MKLKRPEGMKGLDVSALSEQHHQKGEYKSESENENETAGQDARTRTWPAL